MAITFGEQLELPDRECMICKTKWTAESAEEMKSILCKPCRTKGNQWADKSLEAVRNDRG